MDVEDEMVRWSLAAMAALTMSTAWADPPTQQVTLPTGRAVAAEVITAPADGSVDAAILATLKTVIAGDFTTFLTAWCDPSTCADARQQEQLVTYNLPSAQRTGAACLHGDADDQLWVTRRREENGLTTVYLWCGDGRMPAPSTWRQVDGAWKTSSFSW